MGEGGITLRKYSGGAEYYYWRMAVQDQNADFAFYLKLKNSDG